MIFSPPAEIEFFERGFGLSEEHDPDEAVLSYVRAYEGGTELVVTFAISSISTVYARISQAGRLIAEVTAENIREASFQSWHDSKILRMSFTGTHLNLDMRVHYEPHASIHMAALAGGA